MALTKAAQAAHASSTNTAGSTTDGDGGWLATNYGVSGVATITNGATGPTVGCDLVVRVADDSAGTNAQEWYRATASSVASAVTRIPFSVGIGSGGDFPYYRVQFTGNTGQSVTVAARASTTTAL